MRAGVIVAAVAAVALSGCATKRYGRLTQLSDIEGREYTCHDIKIEQAKVQAFQDQVARGAKIDWRSVAGFLGDYGIGNAMERADAEKSARKRQSQLAQLSAEKGCEAQKVGLAGFLSQFMGR